jgi:hypothetical protein
VSRRGRSRAGNPQPPRPVFARRGFEVSATKSAMVMALTPGASAVVFQTLLVAKVEQLAAATGVHLSLDDFARDKALDDRAQERRALELAAAFDPEQMTRQAGVVNVDLGRLDDALAQIVEIGPHHQNLSGGFENIEPVSYRGHAHPERRSEIRLVEHAAVAAGHERKEPSKCRHVPDGCDAPYIALDIRLQVRAEPQPASPRPRHHLRIATVEQVDLRRLRQRHG